MSFTPIETLDYNFELVDQAYLADEFHWNSVVSDGGISKHFEFRCQFCVDSVGVISMENAWGMEQLKKQMNIETFRPFGGCGMFFKLIECDLCHTAYYVGFGYTEPNNGRDVFFVLNIIQVLLQRPQS